MPDYRHKKGELLELLKLHFGFESFRLGQEKAIDSLLAGKDTLVIMPTGGGKSLIYQLTALVLDGATIVISPLIALMKDQVDSLNKIGISATFINSSISPEEASARLAKVAQGDYRLIFVAPERFYNQNFLDSLKDIKVSLFAIDEAHCISQWGHDFRPSYLRLKEVVKFLGQPLVAALTATATPEVKEDIVRQLDLKNPEIIITGFARENLQFGVLEASEMNKISLILDFVKNLEGESGIIYAGTRAKADEILSILTSYEIEAVAYHAGMDQESRAWVQDSFMKGEAKIVVATNAFGLGINKKDIRFVIHHDMPGTIEAYYQEAGRAGRDGQPSYCLLLYSSKDRYLREFFIKGDNPPPRVILEVYEYLLRRKPDEGDSLLLTYSEIAGNLSEPLPEMAVGTCLKVLEKHGIISRPNEKNSQAYVKSLVDFDELLKAISSRAKSQIEVLYKLGEGHKDKLAEGWEINFDDLAILLGVKKEALIRTMKSLSEKSLLEYRPPFRGTEIRLLKKVNVEEIDLDFKALDRKLERAYEKLDEMENYIFNRSCRQEYILRYFGDLDARPCEKCDACLRKENLKPIENKREMMEQKSYLSDF